MSAFATGCKAVPRTPAADAAQYSYTFRETTGITSSIRVGSRDINIEFTPDSDQRAVQQVLDAQTDFWHEKYLNPSIVVVGHLDPQELMTPRCAGCAESEPYHNFRLDYWYRAKSP